MTESIESLSKSCTVLIVEKFRFEVSKKCTFPEALRELADYMDQPKKSFDQGINTQPDESAWIAFDESLKAGCKASGTIGLTEYVQGEGWYDHQEQLFSYRKKLEPDNNEL